MRLGLLTFVLAALVPLSANAYQQSLPKGSMICGSQQAMDEAVRAIDASDVQWLGSLQTCFLTSQSLKAQRISCEGRTCLIRFWVPGGESATAYTLRSHMAVR